MCSIIWHQLPQSAWMIPDGNSCRRRELEAENKLPTISEIQSRLGAPFAQIFFQSIKEEETIKQQIGMEPPLKGATEELWISPEDTLEGKHILTEPHSTRCIQALTHQSILDIGLAYEKAVDEETLKRIRFAFETAELQMKKKMDGVLDAAVQKVRASEKEKHLIQLQQHVEATEKIIQERIEEMKKKLTEEAQLLKAEALRLLKEDMEQQMKKAVEENEKYLTKKFNFQLTWKTHSITENYLESLKNQKKDWNKSLKKQMLSLEKKLQNLKFELEAKHMTDLLRIYQEKMLEINKIKERMEENVLLCFDTKDKIVEEKNKIIKEKEKKIEAKDEKIQMLKEKMNDLALQFQKFIQFALKEKSGQAQYLLSVEQLMKDKPEESKRDSSQSKELDELLITTKSEETLSLVMALIIDTIMTKYEKKNSIIPLVSVNDSFKTETFEERVERERAINRKINLITSSQTSQDEFKIDYLKERIEAIKEMFPRSPSTMNLFLETKAAITSRRSFRKSGVATRGSFSNK